MMNSLLERVQDDASRIAHMADEPGSELGSIAQRTVAEQPRRGNALRWLLSKHLPGMSEEAETANASRRVCELPAREQDGLRYVSSVRFTQDDHGNRVPTASLLKVSTTATKNAPRRDGEPVVAPFFSLEVAYDSPQGPEIKATWDPSRLNELTHFAEATGNAQLQVWAETMKRLINPVASPHMAAMHLKGNRMSGTYEHASVVVRTQQLTVDLEHETTFQDVTRLYMSGYAPDEKDHDWHTATGGFSLVYNPGQRMFESSSSYGLNEGYGANLAIQEHDVLFLMSQLLDVLGRR